MSVGSTEANTTPTDSCTMEVQKLAGNEKNTQNWQQKPLKDDGWNKVGPYHLQEGARKNTTYREVITQVTHL